MAVAVPSKYALKSLHEEIALFDRKLAHLQKYEAFPSEKDRLAAAAKMAVKRSQLVRAAQVMTEAGIEFQPTELPGSFRASSNIAEPENGPAEVAVAEMPINQGAEPAYQGTVLDFRSSIAEYKKRRKLMA